MGRVGKCFQVNEKLWCDYSYRSKKGLELLPVFLDSVEIKKPAAKRLIMLNQLYEGRHEKGQYAGRNSNRYRGVFSKYLGIYNQAE